VQTLDAWAAAGTAGTRNGMLNFAWLTSQLPAIGTTFQIRDIRVDTAGAGTAAYRGAVMTAGSSAHMIISELKR
jgi:hypothetical protein